MTEEELESMGIAAISARLDVLHLNIKSDDFKTHAQQDIERYGLGTAAQQPGWFTLSRNIGAFVDSYISVIYASRKDAPLLMLTEASIVKLHVMIKVADAEAAQADIVCAHNDLLSWEAVMMTEGRALTAKVEELEKELQGAKDELTEYKVPADNDDQIIKQVRKHKAEVAAFQVDIAMKDQLMVNAEAMHSVVIGEHDQLRNKVAKLQHQASNCRSINIEPRGLTPTQVTKHKQDIADDEATKRTLDETEHKMCEENSALNTHIRVLCEELSKCNKEIVGLRNTRPVWGDSLDDDDRTCMTGKIMALEVQVNDEKAQYATLEAQLASVTSDRDTQKEALAGTSRWIEELAKEHALLQVGRGLTLQEVQNNVSTARDELMSFKKDVRLAFKQLQEQQQQPAPLYAKATASSSAKSKASAREGTPIEVDSDAATSALKSAKVAGKQPKKPKATLDPREKLSTNPESRAAAAAANKRKADSEGSHAPTALGHAKKKAVTIDLTKVDAPAAITVPASGLGVVGTFAQELEAMPVEDQWEAVRLASGSKEVVPGASFVEAARYGQFLKATLANKSITTQLGPVTNTDKLIKAVQNLGQGITGPSPSPNSIRWQDKTVKHVTRDAQASFFLLVNFYPELGEGNEVNESTMLAWLRAAITVSGEVNSIIMNPPMTWTPNGVTCRVKFDSQPAEALCEALNTKSQKIVQNWMTIGTQVTVERWGYQTALVINRCPTGEKYEKERRTDGTIVWGLNRYTMLDIEQELWRCNPMLDTNLVPSAQAPKWKWVSKADYEQYKGSSQLVMYLFDTKGGAHARPWEKHTKQVKLFGGVCPIEPYELPKSAPFCGECKR